MRHTMRHARAPRPAARWGSSLAVLSAAVLVVGLSSPAVPADAAPQDPASSAQQVTEEQPPVEQQETDSQEQGGEQAAASSEGDGDERATESETAPAEQVDAAEASAGDQPAEDLSVADRTASDADPVLSALTVQVTDASGTAVPGVGFELWQESNDQSGLQPASDSDTDAGCTTAADGTCTAGEDAAGAPQLRTGTYYWVLTETPEGYQAPAEADAPAGTVTITDAGAGTDLDRTEVTVTATEEPQDEATDEAADSDATEEQADAESGAAADDAAADNGAADENATEDAVTEDAATDDAEDQSVGTTDRAAGSDDAAARSADGGAMAPLSVPHPSANAGTAVINVNVGGLRTGTGWNAVSSLDGVTLHLYNGNSNGPSTAVEEDWAECVSDNDGDCSFTIPETEAGTDGHWTDCGFLGCGFCFLGGCTWVDGNPAGENYDRQFWVVQESAPAGWYANAELVVGQNSHSASDYGFRTGSRLRAGQTYRSGNDFMASSGNQTSSGIWQNSINNPELPQTCTAGLNVALVLDLSGSMDPYLNNLKSSATGFVDALAGTGSSVALFTFAENAPRTNSSSGRNYPLLAIDSGNNQQTITDRINAYSSGGGTNWDSGLYQVAQSGTDFDLAVVVTDGNATYYRNGGSVGGNGNTTRFVESEYAIFSANAIKAEDTRVLAVGVGDGISGSAANLAAISGPTPYTSGAAAKDADYFQSSWQQLASLLGEIAKGATCQATIDVTKYTQTYGSTSWVPTEGWAFDAAQRTGTGTFASIGDGRTGSDGTVQFNVQFATMDATTTVRLTEHPSSAQQDLGWELVAAKVQCSVNGAPVDATVDSAGLSLTVEDIGVNDHVSCDFYNRQVLEPGIQVIKTAYDSASHDQEIAPGSPVVSGTTVYWTYLVTNTGQTPLDGIAVTDDQVGTATCPATTLAVGAQMTCTASGPVTDQ